MKTVELLCASPASTAICSSMEQRSMVRRGVKPIERQIHNPASGRPKVPCSSQIPISPRPHNNDKSGKTSAKQSHEPSKKGSADIRDVSSPRGSSRYLLSDHSIFGLLPDSEHALALVPSQSEVSYKHRNFYDVPVFRSSSTLSHEYPVYQPSSVLSNHDLQSHKSKPFHSNDSHPYKSSLSRSNDSHPLLSSPTLRTDSTYKSSPTLKSNSPASKTSSALTYAKDSHTHKSSLALTCTKDSHTCKSSIVCKSSTTAPADQIVELRVSIHCKGCEGKVRKHISRMEGVKSYTIDLANKKVTIIGNVTPLAVLTSVSKVKYAEFWAAPASSSSLSSPTKSNG